MSESFNFLTFPQYCSCILHHDKPKKRYLLGRGLFNDTISTMHKLSHKFEAMFSSIFKGEFLLHYQNNSFSFLKLAKTFAKAFASHTAPESRRNET